MPPRHRSITAVFDQSWQLLSDREQAILRGLSVFRGGATQAAACQVTGASAGPISAAWSMRHGCAWAEMGAMRSTNSCASTAQRAWQKSTARSGNADDDDEVRRRHCTWFGEFLSGQSRRMNYHKDVMAALMADFGNLQAAWQWGVEHGQMEMARDMALSLYFIGDMLGWYHFAIQAYAPIIATLDTIIGAPTTPPAVRNGARVVLGWLEYAQGLSIADLGLVEQSRRQRSAATRSAARPGGRQ